MENLEGSLTTTSVQDVLKVLSSKNPACSWLISDGWNEKVFYFSTGGVRLYSSDGRRIALFEDFLVRSGVVSAEQMEVARDLSRKDSKTRLVDVLELKGIVPGNKIREVLADLIYLELCDLTTWEHAIFEFYAGNPPPEIFDNQHPAVFGSLDVPTLAERVHKWAQEWATLKGKLYSERLRPCLALDEADVATRLDLPKEQRVMLPAMVGDTSLRDIAISCDVGFPEVARAVCMGMQDKCIRATLVQEKQVTAEPEVIDEIEKLEDALDRAINKMLVHKRIAADYEQINDGDRASEHYHVVGNLSVQAGRNDRALDNYRRAIKLSPQNLSAHESLIRTLKDTGDDEGALDEIFSFAKSLVSFGFLDRAYAKLKSVSDQVKHRFDVRLFFADMLQKMGRNSEAVREYVGIANAKHELGQLDDIELIYLKILALDPVNRQARQGLKREKVRRAGKGLVWIHRVTGLAACLLLLAWGASEMLARHAWASAKPEVNKLVEGGQVGEGIDKIRTIAAQFPGTFLAQQLVKEETRTFKQAFFGFEAVLSTAREKEEEGRLVEARELLQNILDFSPVPSQAGRAEELAETIDAYRDAWQRMRRRAEKLLESRYREQSFKLSRQIVDSYPEGAHDLKMPFLVQSVPDGALVQVDGMGTGYTPLWIYVRFGREQEVRLKLEGKQDVVLEDIEYRESPFVNVNIR
jgi:tetratricopeptide (TPR) repeat protein